jgi:hypothetical protein
MNAFQQIKNEFTENKRLFVFIHLLFWLVFIIGIIVAIVNPQLLLDAVQRIHSSGFAKWIAEIYKGNNIALALFLTFFINLFVVCILTISIPSFFVSGLGVILGLSLAYKWGSHFLDPSQKIAGIPYYIFHLIVDLLEGEAYILAMIAGVRINSDIFHLKTWIASRRMWLKVNLGYYKAIMIVLFISAIVEVSSVKIYLWFAK